MNRRLNCWSARPVAAVAAMVSGILCGLVKSVVPAAELRGNDADVTAMVQEFNVPVPMRDGATLSTDIYRPATSNKVPVVLTRTPYTKAASQPQFASEGKWWAEHGYAFVVQDVRGRGDSGGVFYPLVSEAADGYDTLEWLGHQGWSSGRIGMVGESYLGWAQVYAAAENSPFLKAIIPTVTPPDPDRNFPSNFGVILLADVPWLALTDGHTLQGLSSIDLRSVYESLPLIALDAQMGRNLPVWRDWVNHPPRDAYWRAQSYQEKLLGAKVPALHISGWYDDVLVGTTENFSNMSERASDAETRRNQRMIIGPWEHAVNAGRQLGDIDFGPEAVIDLLRLKLRWFDHWLKQVANGVDREPRVRVFVMGTNQWVDENEWPIARTRYVRYYLHSKGHANSRWGDGQLSPDAPRNEPEDHYRYDPSDPVPFLNAYVSNLGGPDDYRDIEARPDILVYTSPAVTEATLMCGPLRVKLFAATTAVDTDWTAKVLDVHPDGFAQRLNDGVVRARFRLKNGTQNLLQRGKVYEYDIDAWSTCIELQRGHRLRLEIASSAFPKFDRNLNLAGQPGALTHGTIAEQSVLHDATNSSYLLAPIVDPRP